MVTDKVGMIFEDRRKTERRKSEDKVETERRTLDRRQNKVNKK